MSGDFVITKFHMVGKKKKGHKNALYSFAHVLFIHLIIIGIVNPLAFIQAQVASSDAVNEVPPAPFELSSGNNASTAQTHQQNPTASPQGENSSSAQNPSNSPPANMSSSSSSTSTANAAESQASNNGDTAIQTGNATSTVNSSNNVNTNITGEGTYTSLNIYGEASGDIDLTKSATTSATSTAIQNTENTNSATLENSIALDISTGNNIANNNKGGTSISTGDIEAEINVSNTVNTNIFGNGWFYTLLNIFGSWDGSLILPNLDLISTSTPLSMLSWEVVSENISYIDNEADINGLSGENTALENGGFSEIATGDVKTKVHIANDSNINVFDSFWDWIKINIFGEWNGYIFGLPIGAEYVQTNGGALIFYPRNKSAHSALSGSGKIVNKNWALVKNIIELTATTGKNSASDNGGKAKITTGDIDAEINIANLVNTNLIGNGWNFAFINIFGAWNGHLEFGRPDLWISEEVIPEFNTVRAGQKVTYTYTYGNKGDGTAENVVIFDDVNEERVNYIDTAGGIDITKGLVWKIGKIKPGETSSLTYTVEVNNGVPEGSHEVKNRVAIDTAQADRNPLNNFSSGSFIAYHRGEARELEKEEKTPTVLGDFLNNDIIPSFLRIRKSHNALGKVYPGDNVAYTIVIKNKSDEKAYNVFTEDFLKDPSGLVISQSRWDLGEVNPHEEIIIEYDIELSHRAPLGAYINTVELSGKNKTGKNLSYVFANSILEVSEKPPSFHEENNGLKENKDSQLGTTTPFLVPIEEKVRIYSSKKGIYKSQRLQDMNGERATTSNGIVLNSSNMSGVIFDRESFHRLLFFVIFFIFSASLFFVIRIFFKFITLIKIFFK